MSNITKYTWIVGASAGIGRALAVELSSQGETLALSARNEAELEKLASELGPEHLVLPLDVTNYDQLVAWVERLSSTWPRIDRVVFLAGIYTPGMIGEASIESIKQIIDVNLYGGIALTKAVMPVLERQDHGQIALCASVAGYRGLPGGQPYSCTKAALINFTESLRAVTPRSIDVKVINPGYVDTRLTKQNTHHMPALISTEEAATAMAKGLNSTCFEVHFPKRFTIPAKLFCMLPNWLYFRLVS